MPSGGLRSRCLHLRRAGVLGIAPVSGLLYAILPDLDTYVGHWKSPHYPVYYPVLAILSLSIPGLLPSMPTVFTAFFLVGAAVHSVTDIFGGGL